MLKTVSHLYYPPSSHSISPDSSISLSSLYLLSTSSISFSSLISLSPPPLSSLSLSLLPLSLPLSPLLRLGYTALQQTLEGEECPTVKHFMGDKLEYVPLTTPASYTPRLFQLSGSTGWFKATEEIHVACPEDTAIVPDHFPFIQETIYNAVQPGIVM